MNKILPLNEDEAHIAVEEVSDPITRNLVRLAVGVARMQFIRYSGLSDNERSRRLPSAPFDMRFMVQVMIQTFSNHQTILLLLEGKTIEEATGWDV